jgi:hypothetical protein
MRIELLQTHSERQKSRESIDLQVEQKTPLEDSKIGPWALKGQGCKCKIIFHVHIHM